MNCYKIYRMITYLLVTTIHVYAYQGDRFDVMTDFAYPVFEVEAMRHDVVQALYFLQQSIHDGDDCRRALSFLEQADSKAVTRDGMTQDDRDILQNLLNQINGLIDHLENNNERRSDLSNICLSLQDKL